LQTFYVNKDRKYFRVKTNGEAATIESALELILTTLPAGLLQQSRINVCGRAGGPSSNRLHSKTKREWNPALGRHILIG
jgi:hypothetical protein